MFDGASSLFSITPGKIFFSLFLSGFPVVNQALAFLCSCAITFGWWASVDSMVVIVLMTTKRSCCYFVDKKNHLVLILCTSNLDILRHVVPLIGFFFHFEQNTSITFFLLWQFVMLVHVLLALIMSSSTPHLLALW